MDFSFTPEQQQFRRELRAFFAEPRVQEILRQLAVTPPHEDVHSQQIYRWLGERGWLAVNWPREYGGLDRSLVDSAIVSEEMGWHGVPDLRRVLTIEIVGLFLLLAGSDEQKQRFLPPMARGEIVTAVLYSEPDCGSDVSALTTRAVADDDGYLLYGSKIYSQASQDSQYGLVTARTRGGDNRYDGITLFLVPLTAQGVEIRPLWNISDERFCDVVFDGVWVSADNVVGQLHEGWELLNTCLAIERTGLDFYVRMRRWLDALIDHARRHDRLAEPQIAQRIVALDTELEAARMMAWKVISQLDRGELDEVSSAMSKWYITEIGRRAARLSLELEGMEGVLSRWDPEAPLGGLPEFTYRECPGMTIAAGTSEIMLYLIAAGGLEI